MSETVNYSIDTSTARILIVDDEARNRALVEALLATENFELLMAASGEEALQISVTQSPDLVLLDIMMPGMDGLETCQKLQENPDTAAIPVIFLSALDDMEYITRGFQHGGVDYITKPFRAEELHARLKTHLRLYFFQQKLSDLVAKKTGELQEAHRRLKIMDDSKNTFIRLLSHQLRTPLNGLIGISDILTDGDSVDDELRELLNTSKERVLSLIDEATLMGEISLMEESFSLEQVELSDAIRHALEQVHPLASKLLVQFKNEAEPAMIRADRSLLEKNIVSLLKSSIRLADSSGTVTIRTRMEDGLITCDLIMEHDPLNHSDIETFFDPFGTSSNIKADADFGLAPPLAQRIAELLGGKTELSNGPANGQIRLSAGFPSVDSK